MPQIVIDELIQQNIEGTNENIAKLKENPLLPTLDFDLSKLDEIIDYEHAKLLQLQETIPYEVIDISDIKKAYQKIRSWVIPGRAPFNKRSDSGKNNSDKGIKDALVACTIDEFLASSSYEKYYLACNDGRLKDYYKENRKISCIDPQSILDELKREFFDEYTIGVIRDALSLPRAKLKKNWFNINDDTVGQFEFEEYEELVILDASSKEIIKHSDILFLADIDKFAASGNFSNTHDSVSEIQDSLDYYSPEQLEKIKVVLMTNDQVYGIGKDDDVKALASAIFHYFQDQLTEEEKGRFNVYYELREIE